MLGFRRCAGATAAVICAWGVAVGCGGGGGKSDSFESITESLSSPTGTVDADSAAQLGEKFEAASTVRLSGMREEDQVAQSGSYSQDCPNGGSFSVSGSGSESSGRGTVKYNNCCYVADCCVSGTAIVYYSSGQADDYASCASMDVSYSCEGTTADLDYSGCFNLSGQQVFVLEVEGETYAVSGSYAGGSGTLEIKGANGTWSCTYTSGSGSCTSSSGGSFSFSAG